MNCIELASDLQEHTTHDVQVQSRHFTSHVQVYLLTSVIIAIAAVRRPPNIRCGLQSAVQMDV